MSTQVIMNELPNCDICAKRGRKPRKARYDAATRWGPWAYMCNSCWFMDAASRELGEGIGQELILKAEPEPEPEYESFVCLPCHAHASTEAALLATECEANGEHDVTPMTEAEYCAWADSKGGQ